MKKKPLSQLEGMQEWLKNEIEKDNRELEMGKVQLFNELKTINKKDIFTGKIVKNKLTLWQRLKKMLLG